MSIQISFSYQRKQVIQALRYHFIARSEIKILMILVNVFALFAATMFFLKKVSPIAFLLSSLLWFTLMVSFWFILPFTIYSRTRTFKDHFDLHFEDGGMMLQHEKGKKWWAYDQFSYVVETPEFFHLYIDPRSFFLIPKDAFADSDQTHEVRLLLREKIGQR